MKKENIVEILGAGATELKNIDIFVEVVEEMIGWEHMEFIHYIEPKMEPDFHQLDSLFGGYIFHGILHKKDFILGLSFNATKESIYGIGIQVKVNKSEDDWFKFKPYGLSDYYDPLETQLSNEAEIDQLRYGSGNFDIREEKTVRERIKSDLQILKSYLETL